MEPDKKQRVENIVKDELVSAVEGLARSCYKRIRRRLSYLSLAPIEMKEALELSIELMKTFFGISDRPVVDLPNLPETDEIDETADVVVDEGETSNGKE